jgi:tripartite-type tricarboxylate transporter receptor subunit TctC
MFKRQFLAAALAAPAFAQARWPERQPRLIVPFAPGSSTDQVARLIAARLGEELGMAMVVENRVGAGGLLANQAVARAAPDGYTLLFGGSGGAVAAMMSRDPGYDPLTDLLPIASFVANPALLVVPAASPIRSLDDMVAAARARRGGLSYGSGGVGTPAHLAGAALVARLGIEAQHIPYRGANEAALAVERGEVDFAFAIVNITLPQVRAGNFRPLVLSGAARSPLLPGVPYLAEIAPGMLPITAWVALMGPAGLPPHIVLRLHEATERALNDEAFRARLTADGGEIVRFASPAALLEHWRAEVPRQRELLRLSGARAE